MQRPAQPWQPLDPLVPFRLEVVPRPEPPVDDPARPPLAVCPAAAARPPACSGATVSTRNGPSSIAAVPAAPRPAAVEVHPPDIERAFAHMVLDDKTLAQFGTALNSGAAIFSTGLAGPAKQQSPKRSLVYWRKILSGFLMQSRSTARSSPSTILRFTNICGIYNRTIAICVGSVAIVLQ